MNWRDATPHAHSCQTHSSWRTPFALHVSVMEFIHELQRRNPHDAGRIAGQDIRRIVNPEVDARQSDAQDEYDGDNPKRQLSLMACQPWRNDGRQPGKKAEREQSMAAGETE